jgi:glutathione S-transferase
VVPTLVHDGRVVTESTVICECVPKDSGGRVQMGLWMKQLDEGLHPVDAEFRREDGAAAIELHARH